jgi:hypothetical protein
MTDGFDDFDDIITREARERRLQIRSWIRSANHVRPRCSGCGNDMLIFSKDDFITAEQYRTPGFEWLDREDLRPGDLLCFWCTMNIAELHGQFNWGHA